MNYYVIDFSLPVYLKKKNVPYFILRVKRFGVKNSSTKRALYIPVIIIIINYTCNLFLKRILKKKKKTQ